MWRRVVYSVLAVDELSDSSAGEFVYRASGDAMHSYGVWINVATTSLALRPPMLFLTRMTMSILGRE